MSNTSTSTQPDPNFAFRTDGYAWFVVFMLCLAAVISFIDRQIISLLVDPIKADLGISDTQVSLLQGFAFALFYSAAAIPMGRLVDAKNRKNIILAGMVLWSFATAFCGLAKVFWQLFVSRMLVGVGEATLSPAGFSILADYFPRKSLTRALSVFTGSSFLGTGIALLVGGFVISKMTEIGPVDLGILGTIRPWQMTFMIVSVPGLLFALMVWLLVREPPRLGVAKNTQQKDEALSMRQAWQYLIDHKTVILPVVFGFTFLTVAMFSVSAWVPAYFMRTHGMTAGEIGSIFGLYFVTLGSAGVISGGLLSDWLKSRGYNDSNMRAGFISALLATPFLATFTLVPDKDLSLILLAPVVFFGTMPFGTGPSALPLIVPNRLRGQMVAIYLLVANVIGQGGGPFLVAVFTDYVLGDANLIRYSISIVCPTVMLIGAAILFFGKKPYGEHVSKIDAEFA
ncbi:MAG: MFS transporter [Rhodospirillaceae bacterium]|jgi:MFS family permease|nr:MFS transporter [Rhodospirillaceae bacterium]MBT5239330.1 MFS transporter [Rhodospirillaceae bacterium]MBT5566348.1 MFS transporter [Rhodospirillaceae bacterium]MBT6088441.1 MFS transporter [Rhodospirillaceae bacterium]MBT6961861.1 MFS transporter [Rhodospirillaceae bacterium]